MEPWKYFVLCKTAELYYVVKVNFIFMHLKFKQRTVQTEL